MTQLAWLMHLRESVQEENLLSRTPQSMIEGFRDDPRSHQ